MTLVKETFGNVLFALGALAWVVTGQELWFFGLVVLSALFNLYWDVLPRAKGVFWIGAVSSSLGGAFYATGTQGWTTTLCMFGGVVLVLTAVWSSLLQRRTLERG